MLEVNDVTYQYEGAQTEAVAHASLRLAPGDCIALVGGNGSGKSTLAGCIAGVLSPTKGNVRIDGMPVSDAWQHVGLVRQQPELQIVSDVVYDEVAFAPRNMGLGADEVDARVRESLRTCGLTHLAVASTTELSGGEQQRLAVAGILAMHPTYLILDEFTTHLDLRIRNDMRHMVRTSCAAGKGVLMATHYAADLLVANHVIVMHGGNIVWRGTPGELLLNDAAMAQCGLVDTVLLNTAAGLARHGVDVSSLDFSDFTAVAGALRKHGLEHLVAHRDEHKHMPKSSEVASVGSGIALDDVYVRRGEVESLRGFTMDAEPGHVTLLVGPSGSGKTTALLAATGALQCNRGAALLDKKAIALGDVGLCMQEPERQLFCSTVLEDVAYGPSCAGANEEDATRQAAEALEALGVSRELWERSPFEVSGGEQRLIAIAGIIACQQQAVVLDEPTAGVDDKGARTIRRVVQKLADEGRAVVVVSHDVDEWFPMTDKIIAMDNGRPRFVGFSTEISKAEYTTTGSLEGMPFLVGVRAVLDGRATSDERIVAQALPAKRYARNGIMFRMPAGLKIAFLVVATIVLFGFATPEVLAAMAVLALLMCLATSTGIRTPLRVLKGISVVLALSWLANVLVLDGSGDIALLGMLGISTEGIVRGTRAVVRIAILSFMVTAVASCTTANEVGSALLAPLGILKRLGVRTDGIRMAVTLALHETPQTMRTFRQIELAQRARRGCVGEGSLRARLESWLAVLVPMIVTLMRNADELADALTVRGFGRSL